ncbi:nucleoside triphosphate pyrophosphatase [Haliea sp. E1-2-M8]|uniref:Maf family protein n=1 Tax=Haliea sp. E1-2-M8 TaxID=3064706 RepID=UPI0027285577|nr:nucleoside triphosphate pyrophosphatase [Haliea sp. E1-2-M8]MDO8862319.1 nucleoside triphosphate pyrophosphatase [Haliea sp. E1-2-M8]
MDLILASTSPYRRALLQRLQTPFQCIAPDAAETPLPGEAGEALATRLALAKARSVARDHPASLVIGSDQVASLAGRLLGKPGNLDTARQQLLASAGRAVEFFTGVALCCEETGFEAVLVAPFTVHFRALDRAVIDNYLAREQPFDCAGSFKCEGLGIALFERLVGDDPTSLEGLPLIGLTSLLQRAGYPVLA